VPIAAIYPTFEINGVTDGAIGKEASGKLTAPYLVVIEAKKGIGTEDPQPQLYAQLLAIAQLNQSKDATGEAQVFGAYTVADSWVFVKATITQATEPSQLNDSTYHRSKEPIPEITIEVFGAYVIADSWTFAKAVVSGLTQILHHLQ